MPNELKTAEQLMETAPDSALHILQHLSPYKHDSGSKRALYGLLMIQALDKNLMPLKPDSLLDFSIGYYLANGDHEHLAACYLFKGRSYKNAFQYDKAMEFLLKAMDMVQVKNDNLLLARIYFSMGDIHLQQRDYKLSRQKYTLAHEFYTKAKNQKMAFYPLLDIGTSYHAAKDYKKAQDYYRKIYSRPMDSLQKGFLLQEMAINFYDYQKFDSANVYFRQVIHYPYIGNNRAIRYYYYADLLFDMKQVDSAYYYAKNSFNYKPDIFTQRECYRIMTNADYLNRNLPEMSKYMNKYVALGDSLRKIESQTKGIILETIHNTDIQVVRSKSMLWYVVFFFLVIIITGLTFYSRYRHRTEWEKLQSEETHLKQKEDRIETLGSYRKSLLLKIDAHKAEQVNDRKKANAAEKEQLDRRIYEDLLHLSDPDYFYKKMDAVLNKLVSKLKSRYPSINDRELNWCCLHLLNIPTTDIYMLLDYKVDGLKKMKQRLALKTGQPGVIELDDLLHRILSE